MRSELYKSSCLVKKWGENGPSGEKSLRSLLTIEGISMWDAMEAELALYLIPDGLAAQSSRQTIRQVLTPYLRQIKYAFLKNGAIDTSDCARWPTGKTALFIGFSPYLARDVLQPVIDMLLLEKNLTPVLLTMEQPTSHSSGNVSWRHSVHRHRGPETVREAQKFAKATRVASAILMGDNRYRRVFEDEGHLLWPLIKSAVHRAFSITAGRLLPDTVAVARHILTVHRPAVIVSIDVADPRTRVYSLLGAKLGIPTVQVQSGGFDKDAVEWRFMLDDMVAVWGGYSREVFLSGGIAAEKIQVTGCPRHDALVGATDRQRIEFRARFGVPPGHRAVIFASCYSLESHDNFLSEICSLGRSMMKAIFDAIAATPGVFLIVKPHPLEDVAETRALIADHSRVAFADAGDDIRTLTNACDAFFSIGSSVTLDALILGKPTVCPAYPGWHFSDLYVCSGAVQVPRSESDILATVREIAQDGGAEILRRCAAQRSEYLASVVHEGGRGATRRVVDLLYALAQPATPK